MAIRFDRLGVDVAAMERQLGIDAVRNTYKREAGVLETAELRSIVQEYDSSLKGRIERSLRYVSDWLTPIKITEYRAELKDRLRKEKHPLL